MNTAHVSESLQDDSFGLIKPIRNYGLIDVNERNTR